MNLQKGSFTAPTLPKNQAKAAKKGSKKQNTLVGMYTSSSWKKLRIDCSGQAIMT